MEILESDEEEDISVSETVLRYPFKTESKKLCFRNRP